MLRVAGMQELALVGYPAAVVLWKLLHLHMVCVRYGRQKCTVC